MKLSPHRIFRLTLDLSLPVDEEPHPVQERISSLLKATIYEKMEQVFEGFDETRWQIKLDQLELDIGSIEIHRMETDFPQRVAEELYLALFKLKEEHSTKFQKNKFVTANFSVNLEVLAFFLKKGCFPWWMPNSLTKDVLLLFHQVLNQEPKVLKIVLANEIGSEWPRKRIVYCFNDPQLKQIIQLLDPINAETIIQYHEKLTKQQEKSSFVKISNQRFKKGSWEVILKFLFEKRGSEFNQRNFLKRILMDLALSFNIKFIVLLEKLKTIALQFKASDQMEANLLKNIIFLAAEEKTNTAAQISSASLSIYSDIVNGFSPQQKEDILPFVQFLKGERTEWTSQPPLVATQLILLKKLWSSKHPQALLVTKRLILHAPKSNYLLNRLPDSVYKSLIRHLRTVSTDAYWQTSLEFKTLIKQHSIPNWTRPALIQLTNRHFLTHAIQNRRERLSVKIVLNYLLKCIAAKSKWTYLQLLEKLLADRQLRGKVYSLNSDLIVYLHQFLRTENRKGWALNRERANNQQSEKKRNEWTAQDWQFYPKKESPLAYIRRIKKWLTQKSKHSKVKTLLENYSHIQVWLPLFFSHWTSAERLKLQQLLWPGLHPFFQFWVQDTLYIAEKLHRQGDLNLPNQIIIEHACWKVLLQAGTGGLSQPNLINESLNSLTLSFNTSRTKLFHAMYDLSANHAMELNLKHNLSPLILQAIQRNLFISTLPKKVPKVDKVRKNNNHFFLAINQFFKTGFLPKGESINKIRLGIQEQLDKNPQALYSWLKSIVQKKEGFEQFCLFFSNNTHIQLLNLIENQAGNIASEVSKLMQLVPPNAGLTINGASQKVYWKMVWQLLWVAHRKGFQTRQFILTLFEKTLAKKGQPLSFFWDKWVKEIPIKQQSSSIVSTVLLTHYFLNISNLEEKVRAKKLSKDNQPTKQPPSEQEEFTELELSNKAEGIELAEFSKMTTKQLENWLHHFLFSNNVTILQKEEKLDGLKIFGKHIYQLPKTTQAQFWKMAADRTTFTFFQQITPPDEFKYIIDVAEVVNIVNRQNNFPQLQLFSADFSSLLLQSIFDQRGSMANQKSFTLKLLKDWARSHNMTYGALIEMLWPLVTTLSPIFRHHASFNIFTTLIKEEKGGDFVATIVPLKADTPAETNKENIEKPYQKLWEVKEKPLDIEATWLIPNAGLVLLWPYFQPLFDRAGMLKDGTFLDEPTQQKAILLLEYLATGTLNPPEHQLVFNKILCGYPVEAPIYVDFEVDEALQELCDGLIEAAVHHWETIGETAVTTFRETFLIREGNLNRTEKHWHLQVNSKTYDVLLKQLPWGIATVNLSWMDKIMKVDWE